jgi:pantothenate kinase-related protein Tda10
MCLDTLERSGLMPATAAAAAAVQVRGNAGTHDLALGNSTLKQLMKATSADSEVNLSGARHAGPLRPMTDMPKFDKG